MALETIYDVTLGRKYIGSYTSSEMCEKFEITKDNLYSAACNGNKIKNKYLIRAVDKCIGKNDRLWNDFERITADIRRKIGKRKSHEQTSKKESV